MTPERWQVATDLASSPKYRWRPAMKTANPPGLEDEDNRWTTSAAEEIASEWWADQVPDLDDAATAGVLLAMLPRGWFVQDDHPRGPYALVIDGDTDPAHRGATLGEACARALLAVWGRHAG